MGRPFQEVSCVLCSTPIDLSADLCADENGKAVHDNCYVNYVAKPEPAGKREGLGLRWRQRRSGLEVLRN